MIYDKLLRLPLFTGMSLTEFQSIMSKTKMDFGKVEEGNAVVRRGEKCRRLLILIDGSVESTAFSDDGSYSLSETINSPFIIQSENIFGRFQEFTRTIIAKTPVSTLTIEKNEIQALLSESLIFRLNFLGSLSTAIQKREQGLWRIKDKDLRTRIVAFFRERCVVPTGHKVFKIKMQTLADILNVSRLEMSHALNDMQEHGEISLSRGKIEIPDLHNLY